MDIISKVFSPNPFVSLQLQAEATLAYLVRIEPLYWAVRYGGTEEVDLLRAELGQLSSDARRQHQETRNQLTHGYLLPVGRERLIAVTDFALSVLETGQELAAMLQQRSLAVPKPLDDSFDSALRLAIQTACLAEELARRLARLPQVGFGGPEIERFRILVDDITASKARFRELRAELEQQLSSHEESIGPSKLVHSLRGVSEMGRLAARAERLARDVHLLVGNRPTAHRTSRNDPREVGANARRKTSSSNEVAQAIATN